MAVSQVKDYPSLCEAVAQNHRIVYLCGAGASMSLGDHRLSWVNWILAGKNYLLPDEQDELNKRIGSYTSEELIGAATYLLERLKSSSAYQPFMENTIGMLHPTNAIFIDALKKIWRMGDLITTTNYDIQMEEVLNVQGVSYAQPAEILSMIRGTSENKIIHLHGMYDQKRGLDDIIADDAQYRDILQNSGAQFIQNLISTYPIVILGCGGTVEDPNLSGFMAFATEQLKATNIPYFYLLKNGNTIPDLPSNAVPVFYGDDYSDLPAFLSELALLRLQKRGDLRSVVSINPYGTDRRTISAFGRMHFSSRFNPFAGRTEELRSLNSYLNENDRFLWWGILGEGGIGKSRLVLEWLKQMPSNWFGFFAKKEADKVANFQPFTDTVIAFDYVLGQERQCADTIAAFWELFEHSPYKLRIVLVERYQMGTKDDWLSNLKRAMLPDARLAFEEGVYSELFLTVTELDSTDEAEYIQNYLNVYLPILPTSDFIDACNRDKAGTAQSIQTAFHNSMDASCWRPLYLSIYTEVWISKNGNMMLTSVSDLMNEYLLKEIERWKVILKEDALVDSFLRVLAVACAIGRFNLTDVNGMNYLEEDCQKLISFFDSSSMRLGADNQFTDLFVWMDELEDADEEELLLKKIFDSENQESDEDEKSEYLKSLDTDERFAFAAPYIKLDADPNEVYLQMLVNADVATDEDIKELERVRTARIQKESNLPDHAWIIDPVFPDIIKSYIVTYAVNDRDAKRFAKLARSNSVLELSGFLSLALKDWPGNPIIQKIAITPPDEALNYFEYYAGLLHNILEVTDIEKVESVLMDSEPLFQRYELELWRRIAIVLTERGNIERLFQSGLSFADYLKDRSEVCELRAEAVEGIDAYCVGIHNSEDTDKFTGFLYRILEIMDCFPNPEKIGLFLCENYGRLMQLKLYKNEADDIRNEWNIITELIEQCGYPEVICKAGMQSAYEYLHRLIKRRESEALNKLECFVDGAYQKQPICEIAEIDALCLANIALDKQQNHRTSECYDRIKQYLACFPDSMHIRSAFVSTSNYVYSQTSDYKRVPDKLINNAKTWAAQYAEEIEFQEGYFGLLLSRLEYAQSQDMRNEQRRVFQEMKRVAENTDYSQYHENNQMLDTIHMLRRLYGY